MIINSNPPYLPAETRDSVNAGASFIHGSSLSNQNSNDARHRDGRYHDQQNDLVISRHETRVSPDSHSNRQSLRSAAATACVSMFAIPRRLQSPIYQSTVLGR